MKKVKLIFPDGSIADVDETDVSAALSAGAKRYTESNSSSKSTSMVFPDGSVADLSGDDVIAATKAGAVKKKIFGEVGGGTLNFGTVDTSLSNSSSLSDTGNDIVAFLKNPLVVGQSQKLKQDIAEGKPVNPTLVQAVRNNDPDTYNEIAREILPVKTDKYLATKSAENNLVATLNNKAAAKSFLESYKGQTGQDYTPEGAALLSPTQRIQLGIPEPGDQELATKEVIKNDLETNFPIVAPNQFNKDFSLPVEEQLKQHNEILNNPVQTAAYLLRRQEQEIQKESQLRPFQKSTSTESLELGGDRDAAIGILNSEYAKQRSERLNELNTVTAKINNLKNLAANAISQTVIEDYLKQSGIEDLNSKEAIDLLTSKDATATIGFRIAQKSDARLNAQISDITDALQTRRDIASGLVGSNQPFNNNAPSTIATDEDSNFKNLSETGDEKIQAQLRLQGYNNTLNFFQKSGNTEIVNKLLSKKEDIAIENGRAVSDELFARLSAQRFKDAGNSTQITTLDVAPDNMRKWATNAGFTPVEMSILEQHMIPDEDSRSITSNFQTSGFINNAAEAIGNTVVNLGKVLTSDNASRTQEILNENSGRLEDVGQYSPFIQELSQLTSKEKKEGLTPQEVNRKQMLMDNTNLLNWWQQFKSGTGDLTGQVIAQAVSAKGLDKIFKIGFAAKATQEAEQAAALTGLDASGTAIADNIFNSPDIISKAVAYINENKSLFISSYANSYDNYKRESLQLMPGVENEGKRTLYSTMMATFEGLSEKIFDDRKVLNSLGRDIKPVVREIVEDLGNGSLDRAASINKLQSVILGGDYKKFLGSYLKSSNEEGIEEAVVDLAGDISKAVVLDQDYDITKSLGGALKTYGTMVLDGGLVAGMAARSSTKNTTFNKTTLYNMAANPVEYRDEVNRLKNDGQISDVEANGKIAIINYATQSYASMVKDGVIDKTQKNDAKNAAYLLHTVNQSVNQYKASQVQDEVVKEQYLKEAERSKKIREGIYNGLVNVDEFLNAIAPNEELAAELNIESPAQAAVEQQEELNPTVSESTKIEEIPDVETHESVMKRAVTGTPIEIDALRIQQSEQSNDETGAFYADKGVIEEYQRRQKTGFYGEGNENLFKGDVKRKTLKFENPLVIQSKEEFVKELAESGDKEAIEVMPDYKETDPAKLTTTHKTYKELDTFIAKKAREKGYDGIIAPLEYVDLRKSESNQNNVVPTPPVAEPYDIATVETTTDKFDNSKGDYWTHLTNSEEAVNNLINSGKFLGKGEDLANFTKEVSKKRFNIRRENGGSPYFQKGKFYGEPTQKYLIVTKGDEKFTPNINKANADSFEQSKGVGVLNPENRGIENFEIYKRSVDGEYYKIKTANTEEGSNIAQPESQPDLLQRVLDKKIPNYTQTTLDEVKEQALQAPNSLNNALQDEGLTVDLIASNTTEDIEKAIQYQQNRLGENSTDQDIEDIDKHIQLLEKGLEQVKGNASETETAPSEITVPEVKPVSLADKIRSLKSNKNNTYDSILGIPVALWDGSIELISKAVEAGEAIGTAIQKGIAYLKQNNVSFDEQAYTEAVTNIQSQIPEAEKFQNRNDDALKQLATDNKINLNELVADFYKWVKTGVAKFTNLVKQYAAIIGTGVVLATSYYNSNTNTSDSSTATQQAPAKNSSELKVIDLVNKYYGENGESAPQQVVDRAVYLWNIFGKPVLVGDSTSKDERAYAVNGRQIILGNITNFDEFVAELAHAAQYTSNAVLNDSSYGSQTERDKVEYERKGSVEYDAHKFIEPIIGNFIMNGYQGGDMVNMPFLSEGKQQEAEQIVKKYSLADKIRSFKTEKRAYESILGIPIALYDGSLELIATAIEAGTALSEAIQKGIDYLKSNGVSFDEGEYRKLFENVDEEAAPDFTKKEISDLARDIKSDKVNYSDAIEGKSDEFVKALNAEIGSKKAGADDVGFKEIVKRQKDYGIAKEDIIAGFESVRRLTKKQLGLIDEVFANDSKNDKAIAELQEAFKQLSLGEKPKSVLKSLTKSDVVHLVKMLSDKVNYKAISNTQLEGIADFIVAGIDLNQAEAYVNSIISNSSTDVRQLLRAKLIVALDAAGKKEQASKLVLDMADEATQAGRQTQSLARAYEILGSKGSPAIRAAFAKKYAESVQQRSQEQTQHLTEVLSEKELEIKELNEKIHKATQKSSLIEKIKEVISNICNIRNKK